MKVLILSANTGEGHNSAAVTLQHEMISRGNECEIYNGLSYMSHMKQQIVCTGHVFMYRHTPKLIGMCYGVAELVSRHEQYQHKLDRSSKRRYVNRNKRGLNAYLREGQFDVIICVHVFAARFVSEMRKRGLLNIPLFFLATDYTCDVGVNQLDMDGWLIPHESLKYEFIKAGIPQEKLFATGIPVREDLLVKTDKPEARRILGLPQDKRIVMIACGSMGAGSMDTIVEELVKVMPEDSLLLALCGKNESLYQTLKEDVHDPKLRVLGFTDKIGLYMDACDLYITKPGGLTTTEAVNKHTPLLLIDLFANWERRNLEFFAEIGCAESAMDDTEMIQRVLELLADPSRLDEMAERCASLFNGSASKRICDVVEKTASEWQKNSRGADPAPQQNL